MIEITQIGNIPIRAISKDVAPYESDVRTLSKPQEGISDGQVSFPQQQYGVRTPERDIEGFILRKQNVDTNAQLDELNMMIGQPTTVFAVYPYRNCFGIDAIWLETRGRIERVRGDPNEIGNIRVRMTVSLLGSWRPVNRLLWQYVDYDRTALTAETAPVTQSPALSEALPAWDDYLAEYKSLYAYYWRYRSERASLMYDPDYWQNVVDYLRNGHVPFGEYQGWSDSRARVTIWQDATFWNHRPLVFYALKGLDSTYDIQIEMFRPASLGGDETVTIDVSALDTLLVAETATGIQATDILIFGDIQGRAVIVRAGVIVAHCTSVFSAYRRETIGAIDLNENVEYRFSYDFLATVEWASMILWRKIS